MLTAPDGQSELAIKDGVSYHLTKLRSMSNPRLPSTSLPDRNSNID
jgi:hypothetical protein